MTRSWVVDGKAYSEGDSVELKDGSHAVTLTITDATGDTDSASYTIVVGQATGQSGISLPGRPAPLASQSAVNSFALSSGQSIAIENTSFFPLLNPRLIGAGKPDYVDWTRYLDSLALLGGLPTDASEASRAKLLEAAWKDLSNMTVHVCSPGREGENIFDPTMLVRGYGYECCSNSARALAYLGAFLDIPARVRSTLAHEFPEFTVAGNMFILDPDLKFRFWADNGIPLSAWTSDATPVSLMNVSHYYAQTPVGGYYEIGPGGGLPYGIDPSYPEGVIRSYYFADIVGEQSWGYREAFSGPDYVVYPSEKIAFRRTSIYVPLQSRKTLGLNPPNDPAPPVGKVVFRRLWSATGPRGFQQDSKGNRIIPLNDLPYPLQDVVFYFSKPISPKDFRLSSAGKELQIGDFAANTWTVSAQQLRAVSDISDLEAIVPGDQSLVAVDIGMQFNPNIFGDSVDAVSVSYADDGGVCQRQLSITVGGEGEDVAMGSSFCDPQGPQKAEASFGLSQGQAGLGVISSYGNSFQGTWGIFALAGVRGYAEISLPRTPGLPGVLRAANEGQLADWEIYEDGSWTPLSTTDMSTTQWVQLPATSSSTTLLRATLREAPATDTTYLSYLSLVEGRAIDSSRFVGVSQTQSSGGWTHSAK